MAGSNTNDLPTPTNLIKNHGLKKHRAFLNEGCKLKIAHGDTKYLVVVRFGIAILKMDIFKK
jgi:hypothetical protein